MRPPRVFLGSSTEGRHIALGIVRYLNNSQIARPIRWYHSVFEPGSVVIEQLFGPGWTFGNWEDVARGADERDR
jgi:O-methyltransferase involved in polyketide biosynthesis